MFVYTFEFIIYKSMRVLEKVSAQKIKTKRNNIFFKNVYISRYYITKYIKY